MQEPDPMKDARELLQKIDDAKARLTDILTACDEAPCDDERRDDFAYEVGRLQAVLTQFCSDGWGWPDSEG